MVVHVVVVIALVNVVVAVVAVVVVVVVVLAVVVVRGLFCTISNAVSLLQFHGGPIIGCMSWNHKTQVLIVKM